MATHLKHSAVGTWEGVETKVYKTEGTHFKDIVRRQLLGPETPATPFELRYFEIAPGGYSSLEIHEHTHTVIIARGRGHAILGDRAVEVDAHDVCHTGPGEAHQFLADRGEALGFYCLVDKDRDRPRLPNEEELERLRAKPELARILRF
ncbi:MAG: cupin domain-containing protein [Spirochaetes bacterium]|nr:cupin domain-containing protein [Spirochaetota bacterium]